MLALLASKSRAPCKGVVFQRVRIRSGNGVGDSMHLERRRNPGSPLRSRALVKAERKALMLAPCITGRAPARSAKLGGRIIGISPRAG